MNTDARGWDPRLAPLLKRTAEIRDKVIALLFNINLSYCKS